MIASPDSHVQVLRQTVPTLPTGFHVQNGRLLHRGIDLLSLIQRPVNNQGRIEIPATPITVRWLPALRDNYAALEGWFATAKAQTGYVGNLTIAYASKANPSEPVARTLLQAGVAYELSSNFDVDVVRYAAAAGWNNTSREVFANGFKIPAYTQNLLRLRAEGFRHVIPISTIATRSRPLRKAGWILRSGCGHEQTPMR